MRLLPRVHKALPLLLAHKPNLELLAHSSDLVQKIDAKDKAKHTALQRALSMPDNERVSLILVEAGASLERVAPGDLCRFAATSTAAIQALLERGVVVRELRDDYGLAALHCAAADTDDMAVLSMLVNVCGFRLARDSLGCACARIAATHSNVVALRWFIKAGADVTKSSLIRWRSVRDYDCAVCLLAAGATVHTPDEYRRTPVHMAAMFENVDVMYALVAAGADLDTADYRGETARQLLAHKRQTILTDKIDTARRDIASARLDFVRYRALQACIGLQSLRLDALQMCEILQFACGRMARSTIPFHIWWSIATTVKHFH
jgi:ankyrin repeat protein